MKIHIIIVALVFPLAIESNPIGGMQKEKSQIFEFRPLSIDWKPNLDTVEILMKTEVRVIDSIRVRAYNLDVISAEDHTGDLKSGASLIIEDAVYGTSDFDEHRDNIRLKGDKKHKIKLLGVDPCPSCRLFSANFDIRIRFFAKRDSGEIKVHYTTRNLP